MNARPEGTVPKVDPTALSGVRWVDEYAKKSEVPSIEEVAVSMPLTWLGQSDNRTRFNTDNIATRDTTLFSLPFPWYLLSVEISFQAAVAADAANYWDVTIRRNTDIIVSKTTANSAILDRTPWRFDVNQFDPDFRKIDVNDTLRCYSVKYGTPPAGLAYGVAVIRYARQVV